MTQLELARKGTISPQMNIVAQKEGLSAESICQGIADGLIVIPANINHTSLDPCGIGKGLRTKVNANIGTSPDHGDIETEMAKLEATIEAKADALMDLSTGGDIPAIRRAILGKCSLCFGTVPIYQAAVVAIERHGAIVKMTPDDMFDAIEDHARDGVDFVTVHCGVNLKTIERLRADRRIADIVSRGGSFLTAWMLHNEQDNPLYEQYDRLLEICQKYDVTMSLGDGLRPGCLADASDRAQLEELLTLGELVDRARDADVQVMVEGPGHVPLDQITANMQIQKQVCHGAPFYVLGPLVTDVAAGHDHITAAIGGALAAAAGADFLCYVTPSEHLALPTPEDVREGVIGARIAAHAGDIIKGVKGAWEWDKAMSTARKNLDWDAQIKLALDPQKAAEIRARRSSTSQGCSMCGNYCAMDVVSQYLGTPKHEC